MEKTDWKRIGWLTAATLVLGAIIGACAGLLTLLLYGVEYVMLGFIESEFIPGVFTVPAIRRIASVTLGLGVAGVIWYLLRTKTEKVPSVKKAVNGGRMPFWQTIVHVVLQIFIVGSGASIGREVAPRELGAMLAQRFCDIFHIGDGEGDAHGVLDRRMVVAVAAGAGLGGVYNAPLAGMFFAVEILLVDVTLEKVAFGLGMSATAAFVATAIKGEHMFYDIGAMQMNSTPSLMLFALLCGTACGVVGALFRQGLAVGRIAQAHRTVADVADADRRIGDRSGLYRRAAGHGQWARRGAARLQHIHPRNGRHFRCGAIGRVRSGLAMTFLAGSDGAPARRQRRGLRLN